MRAADPLYPTLIDKTSNFTLQTQSTFFSAVIDRP